MRELTTGAVWVVFGCGGDRDGGKRGEMGRVAESHADHVVVTTDNPRTEDPFVIMDAIVGGMHRPPAVVEVDRRAAIRSALTGARPGDVVLIAGKGHETYQEVNGEKRAFDDRAVAREVLQ